MILSTPCDLMRRLDKMSRSLPREEYRRYASERVSQAKSRLLPPLQSQVFAPPPDAHHYQENCFVLPWIVHTFHTTHRDGTSQVERSWPEHTYYCIMKGLSFYPFAR